MCRGHAHCSVANRDLFRASDVNLCLSPWMTDVANLQRACCFGCDMHLSLSNNRPTHPNSTNQPEIIFEMDSARLSLIFGSLHWSRILISRCRWQLANDEWHYGNAHQLPNSTRTTIPLQDPAHPRDSATPTTDPVKPKHRTTISNQNERYRKHCTPEDPCSSV